MPAKMAIIKKTQDNKQGWECGGKERALINPATGVLTKLQTERLTGIYPQRSENQLIKETSTPMVTASLPTAPLSVHGGGRMMHSGNVVCKHKVIFTFIKRKSLPSATIITEPGGIIPNEPNVEP